CLEATGEAGPELNLGGLGIQGYGCAGGSQLLVGLVAMEMARFDASIATSSASTAAWRSVRSRSLDRADDSAENPIISRQKHNALSCRLFQCLVVECIIACQTFSKRMQPNGWR